MNAVLNWIGFNKDAGKDPLMTWHAMSARFASASSTVRPRNWWPCEHSVQVHLQSFPHDQRQHRDTTPINLTVNMKWRILPQYCITLHYIRYWSSTVYVHTFFIWNLIVAFTSSTFWSMDSWWVKSSGNFPALLRPGPNKRGICLIKDSLAKKASYDLALKWNEIFIIKFHFICNFISLFDKVTKFFDELLLFVEFFKSLCIHAWNIVGFRFIAMLLIAKHTYAHFGSWDVLQSIKRNIMS